ncbi:MAG: nucleotidyltransferase domain-containing protein [Verrucomicrobia bacterium]|nr:nucleotidyltransferase domain-containing protein [Verrucomicrobiota bacterium]
MNALKENAPLSRLILSAGTRVVTRGEANRIGGGAAVPAGAVGEIVGSPSDATHAYRIRFNDGAEAMLRRTEFTILKQFKSNGLDNGAHGMDFADWQPFIIYRCVVGSQAFGLSDDASDVDRRGIYLPPADLQWSLYGVPEQIENNAAQECYWELRKFLVMALKANPNILECLHTPMVEFATPLAHELLAARRSFLSKLIYQTYNGYVMSQFKKLEQDLRARGEVRWKHAMHLIRLLLSGVAAMREGNLRVQQDEHRDALLAVKRGVMPWPEINAWRLRLHQDFDAAFAASSLPDRPDYARANGFLLKARRQQTQCA